MPAGDSACFFVQADTKASLPARQHIHTQRAPRQEHGEPHRPDALGVGSKYRFQIGFEAPVPQGAPSREYSLYLKAAQRRWTGWIEIEMAMLF
ncbi:MAG: hypothetical protein MJD61_06860 [Proteobacteria bacterium]|nr:hypothetical protein [Pseudomonadota bacterium]